MRLIHVLQVPCGTEWRHPSVLQDEAGLVLVDCPDPGTFPALRQAFENQSLRIADVRAILITHHDYDHIGTLAQMLEANPKAQVYASGAEAPYIIGEKAPRRFPGAMSGVLPARVDTVVTDGARLPWCGGAKVILTPGHTPGHLSLYLSEEKTLVAGDALYISDGELRAADPRFTADMPAAIRSIRKLLDYDIARVICYHGGMLEGGIRQRLLRVLEGAQGC